MARNDVLREARIQRHWTQSTLAAQLNTTRVTIVRWEQGKTWPSLYFRAQLCQLFGLTEQELGLSQLSSEMKQPQVWLMPEVRNPFFTGRETMLQDLHTALWRDNESVASRIHIISGLAGVGKTQVALEYAYQFRQHYAVIAWVRAETRETLCADLIKLAMALHLPGAYEREEMQVIHILRTWLSKSSNWLLIFDNVEDFALVSSIFPAHDPGGSVLITTRMQATGRFNHLNLKEMSSEEGVLLLLRRAKLLPIQSDLAHVSIEERTVATQLCQEFGGLSLAIDQAGSYIEETGCSVAGYLERFTSRRTALLSWRGQQSDGYPCSVAATLQIARERVERRSPVAGELLSLCLFFHPDSIPETLITHGTIRLGVCIQDTTDTLLSLDEAFAVLNASSLLRRDPATHFLTMHRLIQMVLRDQLEEDTQRLWVERALQALQHLFPANSRYEMVVWPLCELLLPHVIRCIEHMERLAWGEQQPRLANLGSTLLLKAADYLLERARYMEAESLLEHALTLCKHTNDPARLALATALRTLAILYERLGRYSEAEALIQQVLVIQRQELEKNDFQIADALNILALLYGRQGKYVDAEQLARQAFCIYQQGAGEDSPGITEALHTLAQLGIWMGNYPIAVSWAERALCILETNLGPDHPSLAAPLHTLALTFWEQGEYTKAERLFQRIFALWEQTFGPDHPFIGYALHNRALLYKVQGEYAQAEELFLRVLTLWEQTLGPNHPERSAPLKNLSEIYLLQQRYSEAETTIQRVLEMYRHSFGPTHPQMAVPFSILAAISAEQGFYERAETLYQQACQLCSQCLDQEHPHMALALHGLAKLYRKREMYTQARPLFQRALSIRMQKLGVSHPDTQMTKECYRSVLAVLQDDCRYIELIDEQPI